MNCTRDSLLVASLSAATGWYNVKLTGLAHALGSFEAIEEKLMRGEILPEELTKACQRAWDASVLERMSHELEKNNISVITYTDTAFPDALRHIDDPPYLIYSHGDISCLNTQTCISGVGTRGMSAYGKRAIARIIGGLKGSEMCIVSGLALGVDAEVHRQALVAGLKTVAVLGGGLDRYEPTTNARLGEEIREKGGVISEYPPGVRPMKHHFLESNRIVAGLSRGTIVFEGKGHSGSLVTARLALKYGREVGVLPGDIFLDNSQAPLRLLKDGAWPMTESNDVFTMLGIDVMAASSAMVEDDPVCRVLQQKPLSVDELCLQLELPLTVVQERLMLLELDGLVATTATGEYYRKA